MKNFIKIFILSVFAGLVSFSCQKEIDIDANPLDQKYVIEGKILNGGSPEVKISKTGFYYDPIDVSTIENLYIHNAVVTITNGSTQITLVEECDQDIDADMLFEGAKQSLADTLNLPVADIEAYFYALTDAQKDSLVLSIFPNIPLTCKYVVPAGTVFLGQEGQKYDLRVVTPDNTVLTSSTTIPLHFYIDSLSYVYNTEYPNYAKVLVNLTFPTNQLLGNYVKYGTKIQGENYFYGGIGGSVYSDAAFAGSTTLSLPMQYNTKDEDAPFDIRGNFKKGDTASLIWHNIDKETYDFLYSIENDGGASPFSSPTKAVSNIVGGLGVWGGYNVSEYSIYIP